LALEAPPPFLTLEEIVSARDLRHDREQEAQAWQEHEDRRQDEEASAKAVAQTVTGDVRRADAQAWQENEDGRIAVEMERREDDQRRQDEEESAKAVAQLQFAEYRSMHKVPTKVAAEATRALMVREVEKELGGYKREAAARGQAAAEEAEYKMVGKPGAAARGGGHTGGARWARRTRRTRVVCGPSLCRST
jgi:hypothetical protein